MLEINIQPREHYDEELETFFDVPSQVWRLEHSLVSLSKWESFFQKPFFNTKDKTDKELLWYVHAMVMTPTISLNDLSLLSEDNFQEIQKYIESEQTATTIHDSNPNRPNREVITAELIYYWMISYNIPFECQYWHLSRLLMLIRVCNLKNTPPKKMSRHEHLSRQRQLNAQRRAQLNSSG